ncbi:hypothetical protein FA95DRAFT_1556561 [Auriscalpium vulgare]|uniref:Uncharacterized protein n=1 Tax=Auriscalpium vulgare TaxID=40419 RepID=A0ACB8S0P5_9AGAM|nr:hypothetical protein FA95DRAFT_1556561 [Auriscalpium vulgare]
MQGGHPGGCVGHMCGRRETWSHRWLPSNADICESSRWVSRTTSQNAVGTSIIASNDMAHINLGYGTYRRARHECIYSWRERTLRDSEGQSASKSARYWCRRPASTFAATRLQPDRSEDDTRAALGQPEQAPPDAGTRAHESRCIACMRAGKEPEPTLTAAAGLYE